MGQQTLDHRQHAGARGRAQQGGALADGVAEFAPPVDDFALTRVELGGTPVTLDLRGAAIALATGGEVTVDDGDERVVLAPGSAVYVGGGARSIVLSGVGEAFVAQPGRDAVEA